MSIVKLVSRAGLAVELPQSEFDQLSLAIGPVRARERVLSDAGRALKHRRELAAHYAQALTDADRANVNQMARAMIRRTAIEVAARELGYGNYLDRIDRGGAAAEMIASSESYQRAIRQATERAGNIDDTPTDDYLCAAAEALGFSTERTADWDRRWLCTGWVITAPDGWDNQPAALATATA